MISDSGKLKTMNYIHPAFAAIEIGFKLLPEQTLHPDIAFHLNAITGQNQDYYRNYEYVVRQLTQTTINQMQSPYSNAEEFLFSVLRRDRESGYYQQFYTAYSHGQELLKTKIDKESRQFSSNIFDANVYEIMICQEEAMCGLFDEEWIDPDTATFDHLHMLAQQANLDMATIRKLQKNRLPAGKDPARICAPR